MGLAIQSPLLLTWQVSSETHVSQVKMTRDEPYLRDRWLSGINGGRVVTKCIGITTGLSRKEHRLHLLISSLLQAHDKNDMWKELG